MTSDDIKRLRELAGKATNEPWEFDQAFTPVRVAGGEAVGDDPLPYGDVNTKALYQMPEGEEVLVIAAEVGADNGRFIAAANPSTITDLCDLAERALAQDAQPSETVDGAVFNEKLSDACDAWMGDEGKFTDAYNDLVDSINAWQRSVTAKAVADERERAARLAIQWGNARNPDAGGHALRNYAQALRDSVQVDDRPSDYHWANAQPVALDDERKKFEAWGENTFNYGFEAHTWNGAEYLHEETQMAWEAWQARALLSASSAEDHTVSHSELARKILAFMGHATTQSLELGADPLADRLAEKLHDWVGDLSASSAALEAPPVAEFKNLTPAKLYDICCRQSHHITEADKCIRRYADENSALREQLASSAAGRVKPATEFPELPNSVFKHHVLGEMWDRLAMHQYAFKYALACIAEFNAIEQPNKEGKWISVNDRLPEKYEEVLVFPHPTDYCITAERDGNGFCYGEYTNNFGHETVRIPHGYITHWMPLPPAPALTQPNKE